MSGVQETACQVRKTLFVQGRPLDTCITCGLVRVSGAFTERRSDTLTALRGDQFIARFLI